MDVRMHVIVSTCIFFTVDIKHLQNCLCIWLASIYVIVGKLKFDFHKRHRELETTVSIVLDFLVKRNEGNIYGHRGRWLTSHMYIMELFKIEQLDVRFGTNKKYYQQNGGRDYSFPPFVNNALLGDLFYFCELSAFLGRWRPLFVWLIVLNSVSTGKHAPCNCSRRDRKGWWLRNIF